jgi:polyhydroxybutyrate depolymerase
VQAVAAVASAAPPRPAQASFRQYRIEVDHGGQKRRATVQVPASFKAGQRLPVVLNFHGFRSYGDFQIMWSDMAEQATARGMITVHPEGVGTKGNQSWNAGACCGNAQKQKVDDPGFIRKLLTQLESKINEQGTNDAAFTPVAIDRTRVFSTGFSNGASLTYALAAEFNRADAPSTSPRLAAIAPVGSSAAPKVLASAVKIPTLHIHGTRDPIHPLDPQGIHWGAGVRETFEKFGDSKSRLVIVDGGGHTWPGTKTKLARAMQQLLGPIGYDVDATKEILDFFERF